MKTEERMGDFEKIADKVLSEDDSEIKKRMTDFEAVPKEAEERKGDSILPFGLKRYKTCPSCSEFMEIHKIEAGKAIYRCKSCHNEIDQVIEG